MGVALAELLPLLRQSIDWFEGLVREQGTMSEVRSSELESRFSSKSDLVEGDTTISTLKRLGLFTPSRRCVG